jgi:hypothetical protein
MEALSRTFDCEFVTLTNIRWTGQSTQHISLRWLMDSFCWDTRAKCLCLSPDPIARSHLRFAHISSTLSPSLMLDLQRLSGRDLRSLPRNIREPASRVLHPGNLVVDKIGLRMGNDLGSEKLMKRETSFPLNGTSGEISGGGEHRDNDLRLGR